MKGQVDSDTQRPSVITPADRHYSEARSIEDVWRVTDRLPIWRRECNRVLTPCAPSKIRKGDFVELRVTLGKRFPGIEPPYYALLAVVRLASRKQVQRHIYRSRIDDSRTL